MVPSGIDLAFLLLVAKGGRPLGRRHLDLVAEPSPVGLHFEPDVHTRWSDARGSVALGCWRRSGDPRTEGSWVADALGATLTTGPVRVAGREWPADGRWAAAGRAFLDQRGPPATDQLRGVFTLVSLCDDGGGLVVSDPLGLSFCYLADDADVLVVSSRAALAAQALASPGQRPLLDVLGTASLAFSSYRTSDRTGFAGVRTAGPGTTVVLRAGGEAAVVASPPPWTTGPSADGRPALDVVLDEICELVTSTLTLPGPPPVADLTGGKDSRLVLAAALHAGVAERLRFRTVGPPELVDVQIAGSLAERVGVPYESGLQLPERQMSFAERSRAFVAASGGIANVWGLKLPGPRPPEVRLSGLNGECLRSHAHVPQPLATTDDLVAHFDTVMAFGRLGLLRAPHAAELRDEALALLLDDPAGGSAPLDLLESFQIRTRARARYGPLDELDPNHRVLALYSIEAIRAAFSLDPWERHNERVHYELMGRVSPILVEHPFAGAGWSHELHPGPPAGREPVAGSPAAAVPLMNSLRGGMLAASRPLHEAALADDENPVWEVLDRARTRAALERIEGLGRRGRMEVFGAVTAALWLSQT